MRYVSNIVMFMLVIGLLMGCKPSEKYAGEWYAVAGDGAEVLMHFDREEKLLRLTQSSGEEEVHRINQSAAGIKNSLQYFRIEIDGDGNAYYIIFKNRKDLDKAAFVKQTNYADDFDDMVGEVIFTMSRD